MTRYFALFGQVLLLLTCSLNSYGYKTERLMPDSVLYPKLYQFWDYNQVYSDSTKWDYYHQAIESKDVAGNDSLELITNFLLVHYLIESNQYELALQYVEPIEKQINRYPSLTADLHETIGGLYYYVGSFDLAEEHYVISARMYDSLNYVQEANNTLNNLSAVYSMQNKRLKELETLIMLSDRVEKSKDSVMLSRVLINLVISYQNARMFDKAFETSFRNIKIAQASNDSLILSYVYGNLANAYAEVDLPDSAIYYYNKGVDVSKGLSHKTTLIQCLNGLGSMHVENNDYQAALPYLSESYELSLVYGGEYVKIINALSYAHALSMAGESQDSAIAIINRYLPKAEAFGLLDLIEDGHWAYGVILASQNKFEEAYDHLSKVIVYRDSLDKIESEALIADLSVKYETERKERENIHLAKENQLQDEKLAQQETINTYAIVGVIILLLLLVIILFNQYKLRKLYNLLKKRESDLVNANEKLEILNQNRERMIATIAHDLRGPLSGISQITQMMKEQNQAGKDIDELINMSHSASKTTHALLENLLDWAREKQGLSRFKPAMHNLNESVTDVFGIYDYMSARKNIELINSVDVSQTIFADIYMLETILRNLVSNALKFTNQNGSIEVQAKPIENGVQVAVIDTGIGIPPEKIEHLFERKISEISYGTQKERGTGFGLTLCQDLVLRHKGKIWVESKEGEGTTFFFILPVK